MSPKWGWATRAEKTTNRHWMCNLSRSDGGLLEASWGLLGPSWASCGLLWPIWELLRPPGGISNMWSSGPPKVGGAQEQKKSTNRHRMCINLTRTDGASKGLLGAS